MRSSPIESDLESSRDTRWLIQRGELVYRGDQSAMFVKGKALDAAAD
jgi:hypothetical protein